MLEQTRGEQQVPPRLQLSLQHCFKQHPLWCLCWGTQMEAVSKTFGIRGTNTAGSGGVPGEHRMGWKAPFLSHFELGIQTGREPTARLKIGEEKGSHVVIYTPAQTQQQKAVIS